MQHRHTVLPVLMLAAIAFLFAPCVLAGESQHKTGDVMIEPLLGMEFVYIGPGRFMMGSPEDEPGRYDDEHLHEVEIKQGFWMGRYEVTFDQYEASLRETRHARPTDNGWGRGNRPVINVKWFDAVAFAAWLSKKTGHRYRLPTEAEWEYACRAGTATPFSFGDDPGASAAYAWSSINAGKQSHPVGLKKPNPWGLYDMHGNVWEWTASEYHEDYDGHERTGSSTDLKSKTKRAVRGGSWYFLPKGMRCADRRMFSPFYRLPYIGFRLVREE